MRDMASGLTSDPSLQQQFDSPGAVIANVVGHVIAVAPPALYVMSAPVLMSHYSVGTAEIAQMLGLGMIMASIAAFCVGLYAQRANQRNIAVLGVALHLAGSLVALTTGSWVGLIIGRCISAIGDGMALASTNAVLARNSKNVRYWAVSGVATTLAISLGTLLLGMTLGDRGPSMLFIMLLAAGACGLPLMFLLPRYTLGAEERAAIEGQSFRALFATLGNKTSLLILFSTLLIAVGDTAIFSFVAVIGSQRGYPLEQIGIVQSVTYITVTVTGLAVAYYAMRWGRARPVLVFSILFAAAALVLSGIEQFAAYAVGSLFMAVAFRGILPFVYGVAAAHDKSGSLTAILAVCVGLGSSIGPNLGVAVMGGDDNFLAAGVLGATLCLIGGAVQAVISFRQERLVEGPEGEPTGPSTQVTSRGED